MVNSRLAAFALAYSVVTACAGERSSAPLDIAPVSIRFNDNGAAVPFNGVRTIQPIVRNAAGEDIGTSVALQWRSSDTTAAVVDSVGQIYGMRLGAVASISASTGDLSATLAVTVTAAKIEIGGGPAAAAVGSTLQYSAVAVDGRGDPVGGVAFAWKSSDTTIATIDSASGRLTAIGVGDIAVTVSGAGVSTTSPLFVGEPTPFDGVFVLEQSAGSVTVVVEFGRVTRFDATLPVLPECIANVMARPNTVVTLVLDQVYTFHFIAPSGASVRGTFSAPPDQISGGITLVGNALPSCARPGDGMGQATFMAVRR